MDNRCCLDKAHCLVRKAEVSIVQRNFAAYVSHLEAAADNFLKAAKGNEFDRQVHEIIIFQYRHCVEQIKFAKSLLMDAAEQNDSTRLQADNCDVRAIQGPPLVSEQPASNSMSEYDVRNDIQRTFRQFDSLLCQLDYFKEHRCDATVASKRPKNEKDVIEELKQCNEELRRYILCLLKELDDKNFQIKKLKQRLNQKP